MPSALPAKDELRILTPIGMLGYGYSEEIFWDAINDGVDAIICDSGSTDGGPGKLAKGGSTAPREGYVRDLSYMVKACHLHRVPILIGSAGGAGTDENVALLVGIVEELIEKNEYRPMKVISISAEIPKGDVHHALDSGRISPCGQVVPELTHNDITTSTRIVAQMGLEPFLKAMKENPDFDIIIGGRAYDPSPYAAFCVYHGFSDLGIAYHMGKLMECGALCSFPKSKEALAIIRHDSFDIVPLDPKSRCTTVSVASHTLYEKSRPDELHGPGGVLYLQDATYTELSDNRSVRVSGARFEPEVEGKYTIKLEAARVCGYQSVFFGGFRDPILISQIDQLLIDIEAAVRKNVGFDFDLCMRVYGKNGVCGPLELDKTSVPKEIAIMGQVRADTAEKAHQALSLTRIYCCHAAYKGQVATAGNFAMPTNPIDIPLGQVCEFCIYHVMHDVDPLHYFPITVKTVAGSGSAPAQTAIQPRLLGSVTASKGSAPTSPPATTTPSPKTYVLTPAPPANSSYLGDIASVVRSKNAGPYELTFDVMFSSDEIYNKVKDTGVLSLGMIAKMYSIEEKDVVASLWWQPARAFKATIKRPKVSGGFGELDTHGSQQHVPLLYVVVPGIPRVGA